ncbi:MAG: alpha/beta-hydrolase family protein, partial [Limnochordales bacterium]
RTGAFSRKVLCVITTTGTGWVDPQAAAALEFMYNGDTALVAMQYSYLPSWLSFLVDRDRAQAAGRELFQQVYERWSRLPREHRPKLLVFGESLGAFGAESAFTGDQDLRDRTDGALFVGPPDSSVLRRRFVHGRDPGSTEVLPIYRKGETVRFANRPADLAEPSAPWDPPRVVYLQHPSDPIVWWSPRLLFEKPDWLSEPRGADVLLVDTAGRLQTRTNLMEELKKVHRVLSQRLGPQLTEVLLVLDATTGQNGLSQARLFGQAVPLTGIILTKLDGTAKGGIVVAIAGELGLPVKLVGVGEGVDDLQDFDAAAFAQALFS